MAAGGCLKRQRIFGLKDVVEVSDPAEIKALAADPRLDRKFDAPTCPLNALRLKRSLRVLSFRGTPFPTMLPRDDADRARKQHELWHRLNERAVLIQEGPEELEPLVNWVQGSGSDDAAGILVQQLIGQLFSSHFVATEQSWDAALTLVAAPRSTNVPKLALWFLSGKVRRAKRLLADMVDDDLSGVNAIGIAVHNVVKSLRHMRLLYAEVVNRSALTAEAVAEDSLFAPVSLYREATTDGELGDSPFSKGSLFVFKIGEACRQPGGRPLVFMDDTWSQCPANVWVPAMLQGVWKRSVRAD